MQMKKSKEQWWNDTDGGNDRNSNEPCPSATSSTTNHTRTGLGWNSCLHGEL